MTGDDDTETVTPVVEEQVESSVSNNQVDQNVDDETVTHNDEMPLTTEAQLDKEQVTQEKNSPSSDETDELTDPENKRYTKEEEKEEEDSSKEVAKSPKNDARHEDDDDDEYDPEAFMSSSVQPSTSDKDTSVQSAPSTSATPNPEALLQSVLNEFGSKQQPQQEQTNQSSDDTKDLHKILSSFDNNENSGNDQKSKPKKHRELDLVTPQSREEIDAYNQFLRDEDEYVGQGKWDAFPYGSRLFVGNLPTEKIQKWQVYRIFSVHGPIAQISMKSAYGFVQYRSPESCTKAIENDQGIVVKGNHLLLQISRPQGESDNSNKRNRSRSPVSRHGRDRDNRDRNRRGQRTRSPMRRNRTPDVVILLLDHLDRGFINYVEGGLKRARLYFDVEDHYRRGNLQATIQQLAYDGVMGVITLDSSLQRGNVVSVQIFEQGSNGNIRYDEYSKIELNAAVDLLSRARSKRNRPNMLPNTGFFGGNNPNPQTANLMSTLQNMDPAALQQMLSTMQQQQSMQQPAMPMYNQMANSQMYYGGYGSGMPSNMPSNMPSAMSAHQPPMPTPSSYPSADQYSASTAPASASGQSTQHVQSIMDQLARLQGRQS